MFTMGLFGAIDTEQAQAVISTINAFCAEYWWGGPALVFALALFTGFRNRSTARRNVKEREEAVALGRSQAAQQERDRIERERRTAEANKVDPNRPLSATEKVLKVITTGIALGVDKWNWTPNNNKLTCTAPGFDKLSMTCASPVQTSLSLKGVSFFIADECVDNCVGTSSAMKDGMVLVQAKWQALEAARLTKLAEMVGETEPVVLRGENIQNIDLRSTITLSPGDLTAGTKIFDKLVAILQSNRAFTGGVAQDSHFYSDQQGINFRVFSPTNVDIWVGGTSVMMLFTPQQQMNLARICYQKVQNDTTRKASLDNVVALVDKFAAGLRV